jgi:hypothetical protein
LPFQWLQPSHPGDVVKVESLQPIHIHALQESRQYEHAESPSCMKDCTSGTSLHAVLSRTRCIKTAGRAENTREDLPRPFCPKLCCCLTHSGPQRLADINMVAWQQVCQPNQCRWNRLLPGGNRLLPDASCFQQTHESQHQHKLIRCWQKSANVCCHHV